MQEKYKIGDIVRVRSNLKGNTRYYYDGSDNEYLFFNIAMQKFCGHAYKIIDKVSSFYPGYVNYRLALGDETCEWVFSDIMLEPVQCLGGTYMQEKKELKVGDWVRVKRNLAVHEIGVKYLGKVYRINRISYTGYYLSGTPEGYWYRSSLIPVGNLSRLVEIRKENHEI
jgi:hypothetical protein